VRKAADEERGPEEQETSLSTDTVENSSATGEDRGVPADSADENANGSVSQNVRSGFIIHLLFTVPLQAYNPSVP